MPGPLTGLKILDFTTLLPGPYATMILADLGAEVLAVISGSRPDLAAILPPYVPGTTLSTAAATLGRGSDPDPEPQGPPGGRHRPPARHPRHPSNSSAPAS